MVVLLLQREQNDSLGAIVKKCTSSLRKEAGWLASNSQKFLSGEVLCLVFAGPVP